MPAHGADRPAVFIFGVGEVTGIDAAGILITLRNRVVVLQLIEKDRIFGVVYLQEGMLCGNDPQDVILNLIDQSFFMKHILLGAIGIDVDCGRNLASQKVYTFRFIPGIAHLFRVYGEGMRKQTADAQNGGQNQGVAESQNPVF